MSQRDNFAGGFLLGAVFGSVVGGVLGALLAPKALNALASEDSLNANQTAMNSDKAKRRSLKGTNGQPDMEAARHSLEDKIAQLNDAIDDVRQQLGGVNGAATQTVERSMTREP